MPTESPQTARKAEVSGSAASLLDQLRQLGIHLKAQGDVLRYYPQSAATSGLVTLMKTHKDELLSLLFQGADTVDVDTNAKTSGKNVFVSAPPQGIPPIGGAKTATLDEPMPCSICRCCLFWVAQDYLVHCEMCQPRRADTARVVARLCLVNMPQGDDWDLIEPADIDQCEIIDPPAPCPDCRGINFWWNVLGERRCVNCDPPTVAERLMEWAQRIRQRLRSSRKTHQFRRRTRE